MDELDLEVGADLGDVVAGEVGSMVAVQGGGKPAHRPRRVCFAPDRLPQRQRGLQRRRLTQEHRVPGDGTGLVVQNDGQPRPHGPVGFIEHHHVQLGVVCLPQVIRLRRLATHHQVEVVAIAGISLVRQQE
ncbi:hypothetical protein ABIB25_005183 [Nakamurella sp. UYEF19]